MAARGPLVRPAAHRGAILYAVGVVQFVATMAVVQVRFSGYSDLSNAISDLGNYALSPWAIVYNASVIALGILGIVGTLLLRTALPARRTSAMGVGLVVLGFAGAVGVGVFTEGAPYDLHTVLSFLIFFAGGLGLLALSLAMLRDTRWTGLRLFTLLCGAVSLAALAGIASASSRLSGAGLFGAVERIVVGPLLLWAVVAGIHLLRVPVYDPGTIPVAPAD